MRNILKALDEMVTVYDSFCEEIDAKVPLAILDTTSWSAVSNYYEADATLTQDGVMLDFERALKTGVPAFTLAHEFAHVLQMMNGIEPPKTRNAKIEEEADEIAVRILEEAGFVVKRSVSR